MVVELLAPEQLGEETHLVVIVPPFAMEVGPWPKVIPSTANSTQPLALKVVPASDHNVATVLLVVVGNRITVLGNSPLSMTFGEEGKLPVLPVAVSKDASVAVSWT